MEFKLIKSLIDKKDMVQDVKKTSTIKYQQYTIENKYEHKFVLKIPLRESENFETALNKLDDITYDDINRLLRDFRGIMVD